MLLRQFWPISYMRAGIGDVVVTGAILLEGDMQSGADNLLLEGDEQSGSDVLLYVETI